MSKTQVIIVNFNAGSWLPRAVQSALAYSADAVTVVDNNSTDNSVQQTRELVGANARLGWIENAENRGFAAANNQVLELMDADFAVLMNPDCEINSDTLLHILDSFAQYPGMGIASCRILNEDGSLQATCKRRFPTPGSALVRMLQLHRLFPNRPEFANFDYGDQPSNSIGVEFVEAVSGAFMVIRRSAMLEVGLLDEAYFMHCEDLDWCKRFALAGWKVGFVNQASVIHAKGVSSASRPLAVQRTLHAGMNRFFDKFYKTEYAAPTRIAVKLGIAVSLALRSVKALLKR